MNIAKEKFIGILQKVFMLVVIAVLFIEGCPIYNLSGHLCPCCGITRAWLAFVNGDIALAFRYHALFFFVPLFALVYVLRDRVSVLKCKAVNIAMGVFAVAMFAYALLRWCGFVVMP